MATSGAGDKHVEEFKSFLRKATEFYKNLIVKIRSHYGLPEESSLHKSGCNAASGEPMKLQKCHFLCHRFLVCLGDLARYMEQYEKSSVQKHNWSVAATYYLKATAIWPDSGNPQNQLAVLATYVGDEFLALYHCVRSLAVKEPFPDAFNNLDLLFERNRSCQLHSLSSEAQFDFLKPSERSNAPVKRECDHSAETDFWQLLIRTLSFFFLKSSLEDFPCAFASTMKVLDMMMALDDVKLSAVLESYQLMDSARRGPFRAVQAVSIFIFVLDDLIKRSKDGKNKQHLELIQLALTATFIFMGRLVDRCLKATLLDSCPLLPAVLIFVEWVVIMLDKVEAYGMDDKTRSSMSYFFASFVDLLRQFDARIGTLSHSRTALWEDYELRGFAPLAQIHVSLDFSTNWDHTDSYESGIKCRIQRIIDAAMKIANRSNGPCKWISIDSSGTKFYAKDTNVMPETPEPESTGSDVNVKGLHQHCSEARKECETQIASENLSNHVVNGKSVAMEEEEVILFKPLTRYNSAPIYGLSNNGKDPASPKVAEENLPSDECLRRATSLLIAQNQAYGDTSDFHSDISNFRPSKPFNQQDHFVKDTTAFSFSEAAVSAGPPSLNAWVLNRGSLSSAEKGRTDISRQPLSPIEEIATSSLGGLSIRETEDSAASSRSEASTNHYSPPYSAPIPSAPLLPDDATWFNGAQSSFSEVKGSGYSNKPENFYDASRVNGYPNCPPLGQLNYGSAIPGFMDVYPPFSGMTSSEWLRQYRESRNLERTNSHARPMNHYTPGNPRNVPSTPGASSPFGLFDQYGVPSVSNPTIYTESSILHSGFPAVYGMDEPRREKLFNGYQRPSPYGCGVITELRDEPQPLLQYLKEKEWLLQQDPALRNPTYMGN
ncbi:hypothetical protein COLO4_31452 [Corchorus olitorius]|uniref:DNA/RNA-binding domain, Est1-type n=1 Tax=Corchorus olitorius TaxID=93759 RepID=A0A1R3H4F4_9ROSI|nr:hypothetical protein COLO4_31452 [Corchorus olitorius]